MCALHSLLDGNVEKKMQSNHSSIVTMSTRRKQKLSNIYFLTRKCLKVLHVSPMLIRSAFHFLYFWDFCILNCRGNLNHLFSIKKPLANCGFLGPVQTSNFSCTQMCTTLIPSIKYMKRSKFESPKLFGSTKELCSSGLHGKFDC